MHDNISNTKGEDITQSVFTANILENQTSVVCGLACPVIRYTLTDACVRCHLTEPLGVTIFR